MGAMRAHVVNAGGMRLRGRACMRTARTHLKPPHVVEHLIHASVQEEASLQAWRAEAGQACVRRLRSAIWQLWTRSYEPRLASNSTWPWTATSSTPRHGPPTHHVLHTLLPPQGLARDAGHGAGALRAGAPQQERVRRRMKRVVGGNPARQPPQRPRLGKSCAFGFSGCACVLACTAVPCCFPR